MFLQNKDDLQFNSNSKTIFKTEKIGVSFKKKEKLKVNGI